MQSFESVQQAVRQSTKTWLVTGAAGFIGSHLVEHLILLDQRVIGIDNFSSSGMERLNSIRGRVGSSRYAESFELVEGDICDFNRCLSVCSDVDYVLHQAAMASVPRSLESPLKSHGSNVTGSLNLMWASVQKDVKRFVFASSSAVYGDHPELPNIEENIGRPLSPYALDKYICELYAYNFFESHQLETIGLRYFNVFGPGQSMQGDYAAVIPSFVRGVLQDRPLQIYGDGCASRDFCYVDNVVQANLLSAITASRQSLGQVFNVSSAERVTVLELYETIRDYFAAKHPQKHIAPPLHLEPRLAEVRHSFANISKIVDSLGYCPSHSFAQGLGLTIDSCLQQQGGADNPGLSLNCG